MYPNVQQGYRRKAQFLGSYDKLFGAVFNRFSVHLNLFPENKTVFFAVQEMNLTLFTKDFMS
jgi:hypothetical protein